MLKLELKSPLHGSTRGAHVLVDLALALGLIVPAAAGAEELEQENSTARYQTTYNQQFHRAFAAPYSGQNSLNPVSERMFTFSTTAHWGTRVWDGGELYFNPEVTAGVPFSGKLVGLGSFTDGEITRAAGSHMQPYVQRLFLRQTWNQGGGTEHLDADFNQMAGTVDKNRFVLTVGNFSTLDVFDDNSYAKDARTQFMNWGNWTYTAYDYTADARGFAWGFAGEWIQGDWALRFGRMTGPREPNGLQLDLALGRHYGDQVELEHAHSLNERPGKLRVLAWRNRAVLARFSDATAYLNTHPGTDAQAIFQVRNQIQTKYGLGLNLEQSLHDNVGYFLRTMKADGRTEAYSFTEADRSFSTGVLLRGRAWGREGDSVGLAWLQNGLSSERRQYLQAGGVSFFIGDGALNYQSEKTFEGFYSLGLGKSTWITTDIQRIRNPGYNASRGPVSVLALRFHAEY